MTYIDMNMIRAGVVKHPKDWEHGGYNEIQNPKKRYRIIDHKKKSEGAFELQEEQAAYSCYENEDWNLIAWNEKS